MNFVTETKNLEKFVNGLGELIGDALKDFEEDDKLQQDSEDENSTEGNPNPLQYIKLYISKEDIADALGIESGQLVITYVKNESAVDMSTEFVVAIDSSATVKNGYQASTNIDGTSSLRRQKLKNNEQSFKEVLLSEEKKLIDARDELYVKHGSKVEMLTFTFDPELAKAQLEYQSITDDLKAIRTLLK
jgi:hypothetical protein